MKWKGTGGQQKINVAEKRNIGGVFQQDMLSFRAVSLKVDSILLVELKNGNILRASLILHRVK